MSGPWTPKAGGREFRPSPRLRLELAGSPPTARELECLVATVRYSSLKATAHQLGISCNTLSNLLGRLYQRIGARDRTHAVRLLWATIGDRLELP